jgi:hypothetical protein
MIVGPPADHGGELGYQIPRWGLQGGLPDLPEAPDKGVAILPGRFDTQLPSILSEMRSEEVKAVLAVGDAGFLRREV